MMVVMPIFWFLSAGTSPPECFLYWFVSNLFYILQQYVLNNQIQRSKSLSIEPEISVKAEPAVSLKDPSSAAPVAKKGGKINAKKR